MPTEDLRTALVISHAPPLRLDIRRALEADLDTVVVEADTVLEGLVWLRVRGFNVIVLDLDLTVLGNLQVLTLFCQSATQAGIAVVALTHATDTAAVSRAGELGIAETFDKPLDRGSLSARLAPYLGH